MYSGPLYRAPFQPDAAMMRHAEERAEYRQKLRDKTASPPASPPAGNVSTVGLDKLLEKIGPEDFALISLVLFLLCDNTENDVVLLGILLYVLISG